MDNVEKKLFLQLCGHCGVNAPMQIVSVYNGQVKDCEYKGLDWEAGPIYEILICTLCSKVTFRRYFYHSLRDPDDWQIEVLYPYDSTPVKLLPKEVKEAYEAASKIKKIDSNAYAVLLGRLMEAICIERGSTGRNLYEKLQDLTSKGEIPERLSQMANQLRRFRNIGAHADLGSLTKDEIPFLEDLIRAIIEYVYKAPALIERVKNHLNKLQDISKKDGNSI